MSTSNKSKTSNEAVVSTHRQAAYEAKYQLRLAQQEAEDAAKKEARAKRSERSNKPGIIQTIFNTIVSADGTKLSKHQILEALMEEFSKDEEGNATKHTAITMMKTINAQLGNKFPNRMEREKQVVFDIDYDVDGNKLFGYTEECE